MNQTVTRKLERNEFPKEQGGGFTEFESASLSSVKLEQNSKGINITVHCYAASGAESLLAAMETFEAAQRKVDAYLVARVIPGPSAKEQQGGIR